MGELPDQADMTSPHTPWGQVRVEEYVLRRRDLAGQLLYLAEQLEGGTKPEYVAVALRLLAEMNMTPEDGT